MTITRAREILGEKAIMWNDDKVESHIQRISVIAEIATDEIMKQLSHDQTHFSKLNIKILTDRVRCLQTGLQPILDS